MTKLVIVCVDDEQIIRDSLEIELKKALGDDYLIEMAESGQDALELFEELLAEQYEIPLIISDYIMPDIKGDEVLKRIHLLAPTTLKIMLTGQADIEAIGNAINYAKLYRYIPKPWQSEDLRLTIIEAIRSYFRDKQIAEQNSQLQQMNQTLEQLNQEQAELIAKLHENEKRLTQFLEAMPVGVEVLDAEGNLSYTNQIAQQLLGHSTPLEKDIELFSKNCQIYVAGSQQCYPYEQLPIVRALHGESSTVDDIEIHHQGKTIAIEVWAKPIFDEAHNIIYAIDALQDITQRKNVEAELARHREHLEDLVSERTTELMHKNEQLHQEIVERNRVETALKTAKEAAEVANRAKSEFLANMSHEIRTPMNAILGFTEILTKQITDPQHSEYLSAIRSSGKSLLTLINDILDLSKVEAGKLILEYSAVDLESVFKDIEHIFSQKIHDKGLYFEINLDPNLPRVIILDETRLRQILLNLVGNAIKFTLQGYIKLTAKAQQHPYTSELDFVFTVEDSGIGIPQAQQQAIFGAFVQQEGQSHAQYGGTGLGLAITQRLIEMMGGEISLASELGQGSVFTVVIHEVETASVSEAVPVAETDIDFEDIVFDAAKVLLVDDIKINRELLRGYLSYPQLEFYEAEQGEEAIMLAKRVCPDIILMDMKMPVMDGREATQFIKQQEALKHIPVIAVTASVMKEYEHELREICDGFLRKPVNKVELLTELMKFINYSITDSQSQAEVPLVLEHDILNPEILVQLPQLMQILQSQAQKRWLEISETLIINDIEEFAYDMKALGESYHYPPLSTWSQQLQAQAAMFDVDALFNTLKDFPKVLDTIQALVLENST